MTESIYAGIHKAKNLIELREYLDSINLTIFNIFFSNEQYSKEEPYYIISYIVHAYCQESPYLIAHADAKKEKFAICQKLNMPEYIADWVLELEKIEIRTAIIDFIKYFAGEEWRNLQFAKIQLRDIEEMITGKKFVGEDGLFDIKRHSDAVKETTRLSKFIDSMERELKGRSTAINIVKEEVQKAARKHGKGANMENSEHIK
jgi:hypothetical protein